MARQIVEWDNWIGHDLGRRAPLAYHYGRRKLLASYSHWRGLNVVRYLNGSVGPRPPFTKLALPFLNANPGWNGIFFKALWVGGVRRVVVIMSNGDVFTSQDYTGNPGWGYIGRLAFVPACATVNGNLVTVGSTVIDTVANPNTCLAANIDPVAATISPITGMPVCNQIVAYNQFIVVGLKADPANGIPSGNSIIWFSDLPANISDTPGISWASAQGNGVGVVGVGTAEPISGLFTQKDTLVIAKQGGEWWTLTGIPTGPPVVRRMDVGLDFKGVGGPVRQSNIWYPNGRDIGTFTGAAVQISDLPDLDDFGGNSKYAYNTFTGLAPLVQADEFMLAGAGTRYDGKKVPWVFIRHGLAGVATSPGWSRHVLDYLSRTGTFVPTTPAPLYIGDSVIWLFLQGQANDPLDVFQFDIRQEVPYERLGTFPTGNPAGIYNDMGTNGIVQGSMSIPEWWAPDGHNAHVMELFIDLDYDAAAWQNASDAGTNPASVVGFTMNVDAINLKGADNARSSLPLSWSPLDEIRPVPNSNTNMVRTRVWRRVGDQGPSSGFKINLTSLRGVQIWRILATVDVSVSEP